MAAANNSALMDYNVTQPEQQPPMPTQKSILAFYLIMVCLRGHQHNTPGPPPQFCMVGAQSVIFWWRKTHQRSYDLVRTSLQLLACPSPTIQVTLLGLWLVPPYLAWGMRAHIFLFIWLTYSCITSYFLHKASQRRLASHIPRTVFAWFLSVYRVSVAVGLAGYVLLLIFFLSPGLLRAHVLPAGLPFTLLWYGLYFGVLGRDSAEVASDRMAAVMGTGRRLTVSINNCGMCGGDLPDVRNQAASSQETRTLPCKHTFHVHCLQGWTIVGKKDTCPQV